MFLCFDGKPQVRCIIMSEIKFEWEIAIAMSGGNRIDTDIDNCTVVVTSFGATYNNKRRRRLRDVKKF